VIGNRRIGRCGLLAGPLAITLIGCSSNVYWTDFAVGDVNAVIGQDQPIQVASNLSAPAGLGSDGSNLYWADYGDGTIKRAPIAGGTPTILATSQIAPLGVAVDPTSKTVFWTTGDGTIKSVPVAGGSVTVQAQYLWDPMNIVVDSVNIYWTDPAIGFVWKCPRTNCAANADVLAPIPSSGLSRSIAPWGIAVDSNNVYFTDFNNRSINQVPIAGGTTAIIAQNPYPECSSTSICDPSGIAVDSQNVYWTNSGPEGGGSIQMVPIGGGQQTTLFADAFAPVAIALDDENVYWAEYTTGQIRYVAKTCNQCPKANTLFSGGSKLFALIVQ
jgi:hypothetical protein